MPPPKWRSPPVYPRRCGEQTSLTAASGDTDGLSPQVRGTGAAFRVAAFRRRFIPAGAGNSREAGRPGPAASVYPRRCGEQITQATTGMQGAGLSPQVRGTAGIHQGLWHRGRFIPAGAGNRPAARARSIITTVYPRRCGEQEPASRAWSSAFGLSPQVRGTAGWAACECYGIRFIPAGAGNRQRPYGRPVVSTVYPRRCGEQSPLPCHRRHPSGLSPQVRGTA